MTELTSTLYQQIRSLGPRDEEDLLISYTWPFTQTPWIKMLVDGK